MRTSSAGMWIIGLLVLGPFAIVLVMNLINVLTLPPCAEQWADWCGSRDIIWTSIPRWSPASRTTQTLHALLLLALFAWPSSQILRAARTRRPLTSGMRYAVVTTFAAWAIVLQL